MNIITSITEAVSGIWQAISDSHEVIVESLKGLASSIKYCDEYIVNMQNLKTDANFSKYPVVESVALLKYLIPTDIFYFIYLFILIGISMTIFKITSFMLLRLIECFINNTSSGFSKAAVTSKVTSLYKFK